MSTTIDQDRDAVRELLIKAEALLSSGDPDAKATNATTAEAAAIAQRWESRGQIVDLLHPLLADAEDKPVRFGAATYLLSRGHSDLAVPVLETVGMAEAKVVLRRWRRQQEQASS